MIYKFLKYMVIRTTIFSLFIAFLGAFSAKGATALPKVLPSTAEPGQVETIFDLLSQEEELIDVTIKFDMAPLMENRYNKESQKATFTYKKSRKEQKSFKAKVELRGKFRRRICQFPPLMIKFSKKQLEAEGLNDHNDLKLVTHCIDDKLVGNDNAIKEYLLYKMYNELTEKSYRVQLIKVTYEDVNDYYPKVKRYGFLIEDTDEMAERLGGKECEQCLNVPNGSLVAKNENLVSLFQFMIGNADWSSTLDRNVKFVNLEEKKLIVPYDFDFSGMVNASYAIPNSDYGLKSLKDRVFLGREVDDRIIAENMKLILSKKDILFGIIDDCKHLTYESKDAMYAYLGTFFDLAEKIDFSRLVLPQLRGPVEQEQGNEDFIINRIENKR